LPDCIAGVREYPVKINNPLKCPGSPGRIGLPLYAAGKRLKNHALEDYDMASNQNRIYPVRDLNLVLKY